MEYNVITRRQILQQTINNIRAFCSLWSLIDTTSLRLNACMVNSVLQLADEICIQLEILMQYHELSHFTFDIVRPVLNLIAELKSFANLYRDYVFDTNATADLHNQLNYLIRHVAQAENLLEQNVFHQKVHLL